MDAGGATPSFFSRRDQSVYYGPILWTLTALLVLLLVWPRPQPACRLQAALTLSPFTSKKAVPSTPELSEAEWALICELPASPADGDGPRVLARRLEDGLHLQLDWTTTHPARDAEILQRAVRSAVRRGPPYLMSRLATASDGGRGAEQQAWETFQRQLNRFVESARTLTDEQLANVIQRQQAEQASVPVSTQQPAEDGHALALELETFLERERERLAELRLTRTEQHPDVIQQRSRVAALDEQWRSVTGDRIASTEVAPSADTVLQQIRAEDDVWRERLRSSTAQLLDGEHELHNSLASYTEARAADRTAATTPSIWQAEITQPPQVVERSGGLGRLQIGLAVLCSLVVGLFSIRRREDALQSVEQLEQEWGGRVVAILGSPAPRAESNNGRGLAGIGLAECLLVAAVVTLLLSLLADPQFAGHVLHDPWMALKETWVL